MFFGDSTIIFFFKLVGLIVSTVQRINKKRGTWTPLFSDQSVKITFILFKCPRFIYLVVKRFMITKNSVVKIQNLVVNHESWPVKSNPDH